MKHTKASPMKADFEALCRLTRNHQESGDFCLVTDSFNVWLSEQPMGEPKKQHVEIPRKDFNRLVRWYIAEQKFVRK